MSPAASVPVPCACAAPYSEDEIKRRIVACPKLASLQSVNRELNALVRSERSVLSQIAEVIRRDPSLAARLLRMVNSVYFGLSTHVNNIEEAVFFLGLRQVRELAMATPVLEELGRLQSGRPLPWRDLWTHSIGTAIMTREILSSTALHIDDDTDYLVGLLHNVGKIIMAYAFPDELQAIIATRVHTPADVAAREREIIGWDHGQIGAYYLGRHNLPDEIVMAVEHHDAPEKAPEHQFFAAAIQVADYVVRHHAIHSGFEQVDSIPTDAWMSLPGWSILYGNEDHENELARAAIGNSLRRLPSMIEGLL
ncbi:HDOD domain-containing protein [Opitutus sp. ER46]|uniref:HDOD domain-containing protein n=1 Tax=Opitutus sp. ER46 TaxID=2161864 RepID=UPI000D328409|nr:HDOD domain-containing protein [Opitutus sp. ER46]PTX90866.1 histidine kinase [Opitutus sp. ER46]